MFVSLGSAAENIEAAVDYMREQWGAKVGSIHPNVFRPFPDAAIIKALAGKKNVIILERTDEPLAGDNPMGRDIRTALHKALQRRRGAARRSRPTRCRGCSRGVYGLGSRDFRPEHTLGAYEFAVGKRARKDGKRASDGVSFFVLGVDHPYEVKSDDTPSLLPEGAIAVRFHSVGGWGTITTGKNLGAIIGDLNDLLYDRDKVVDEHGQSQGDHPRQREPEIRIGEEGGADLVLHGGGAGTDPGELRPASRDRRPLLRPEGVHALQSARRDGRRRLPRLGIRRDGRAGLAAPAAVGPPADHRQEDPRVHAARVRDRAQGDRPRRPPAAHAGQRVPRGVLLRVAAAQASSASRRNNSTTSCTSST